MSDVAKVR